MTSGIPAHVTYDANNNAVVRKLNRILLRSGSAALFKEKVLQSIIDKNPEVLPIRDFFPATNVVCSLGCEIPLDLGERQGFIDNLLVTDDGHLILVETKLWRNPEAVRDVIAQVMQYSMAVGSLELLALEQAMRQGDSRSARLAAGETVAGRMQHTAADRGTGPIMDDFEDAFARFRQTGELLVLIVADGIQTSVERLTRWVGESFAPGAPVRLGLVELRFYETEGGHLVVPVTLLRTKELGRHTVVVEVREAAASGVTVSVRDTEPGRKPVTRLVKGPDTSLDREGFLARARAALSSDVYTTLQTVVAGLDQSGLATKGTSSTWQYGVMDDTTFLGLAMLADRNMWCQIPSRLRGILGPDRFIGCKRILNGVTPHFYRSEDVEDADKVYSLTPRYDVLVGKEQDFINAINSVAAITKAAISEQS